MNPIENHIEEKELKAGSGMLALVVTIILLLALLLLLFAALQPLGNNALGVPYLW